MQLKLGTRRSLLAWSQSTLVAKQLEQLNPGLKIELVGIETKGDIVLDVPLSKIEGKEFFVKELDDALLSKSVDFTVHSFKDLSLERPTGIQLAATPQRYDSRDIMIFSQEIKENHPSKLKIGTSSPRRLQNIPDLMRLIFPNSSECNFDFCEIRGNVNTRLSRLNLDPSDPKKLDAVILALAGLTRLFDCESSRAEILQLLREKPIMVLPLSHCPTAPGQGCLAIECRSQDEKIKSVLNTIHHQETFDLVRLERNLMSEWGGGCHQRFGISATRHEDLGQIIFEKGARADGSMVDRMDCLLPPAPSGAFDFFDGQNFLSIKKPHPFSFDLLKQYPNAPVFIASPAAIETPGLSAALKGRRIWTSGVSSWNKLAAKNIWVEGCADGIGIDHIASTLQVSLLRLPEIKEWIIFTHADASESWSSKRLILPFKIHYETNRQMEAQLSQASYVYWSSASQYLAFHHLAKPNAFHACGAGKTARTLRKLNVNNLQIFPSHKMWRDWLGRSNDSTKI